MRKEIKDQLMKIICDKQNTNEDEFNILLKALSQCRVNNEATE